MAKPKSSGSESADHPVGRNASENVFWQLFRYAIVGASTNLLGYIFYLIITYFVGSPKTTMTALYFIGVVVSFFAHRRFTFKHNGRVGRTGARFLIIYLLGYFLDLLLLFIFVDKFGLAHQYVQGIAVIVVALFLFSLSRSFVFRNACRASTGDD